MYAEIGVEPLIPSNRRRQIKGMKKRCGRDERVDEVLEDPDRYTVTQKEHPRSTLCYPQRLLLYNLQPTILSTTTALDRWFTETLPR